MPLFFRVVPYNVLVLLLLLLLLLPAHRTTPAQRNQLCLDGLSSRHVPLCPPPPAPRYCHVCTCHNADANNANANVANKLQLPKQHRQQLSDRGRGLEALRAQGDVERAKVATLQAEVRREGRSGNSNGQERTAVPPIATCPFAT